MSEHGLCCVECHASGTAQGEHAGASVEQERIIKLLEGYAGKECGFGIEHDLIELIKGENK